MAQRFWVLGSGNTNDVSHWSATSGGSGGASVPSSTDDAIFDVNSSASAYTVTVNAAFVCNNFTTASPASGALTLAGSSTVQIFGGLNLYNGCVTTWTSTVTFSATTTGNIITQNGNVSGTSAWAMVFNGVGGGWTISGTDFGLSGVITLTNGALAMAAGLSISCTGFSSSNSNVRSLTLNNCFWFIQAAAAFWDIGTSTNMTLNSGNSTIATFNAAITSRTFNGGGLIYYRLSTMGVLTASRNHNPPLSGQCELTITGSNTFSFLRPFGSTRMLITDGTTQTVGAIERGGAFPNWLAYITGTSTGGYTISNLNPGQKFATDFLNIAYCTFTGGGFYAGFNSVNGGNNSGITFTDQPGSATVQLDASQPFYAPSLAATALSTAQWTNARAALLDNLATLLTNLNALITTVGVNGAGLTAVVSQVWAAGSRTLTAFGFTVNTNANATETAIQAKTDNLPAAPASTGDVTTAATSIITEVDTRATPADVLTQSTQGAKDALEFYGAIP